jgi:phage terminase large subunit-like protein
MHKKEWLSEITETEIPSLKHRQKVKIWDILIHRETDYVICSVCSEANALSEFTSGKNWNEWKLDYLKQHLKQKVQLDSVIKSQNLKKGRNSMYSYRNTWWSKVTERKKTNADLEKVVIDNVILTIKINTSMLYVQDIHDHLAKYTTIPES